MSQGIASLRPRTLFLFAAPVLAAFLTAPRAHASFHFVNVSEVYTNGDGSVQYVELKVLGAGQTLLASARLVATNADSTQIDILKDFTASYNWTTNQTMLLATAAFQDTAGFAPDFVIPNDVFFPDGRVGFNRDPAVLGAVVIDGVAYGNYTGANTGYGTPAAALPTDATFSLTRITFGLSNRNNSTDWGILGNSPMRTDGTTTRLHPTGVDLTLPRPTLLLLQNRPNPTSGETLVDFALPRAASVSLEIFSVDGRLVRTVGAGRLGAGPNQIRWDGRDALGRPAAGGVYLYRLTADGESAARRLHVVR